jgi:urease accessory protein
MKLSPKSFGQIVASISGLMAFTQVHAHHAMAGATPETFWQGFLSGVGHPVIGVDHLAFIIVAGILAFSLDSLRARLIVPVVFAAATVGGALAHLQAAALPMSETVIALSVLLGGLLVLARVELPLLALSVAVGGFGVFHGYAYGESIIGAEQTPLLAYLAGFALVQVALITAVALGLSAVARRTGRAAVFARRGAGTLATVVGGVMLATNLA